MTEALGARCGANHAVGRVWVARTDTRNGAVRIGERDGHEMGGGMGMELIGGQLWGNGGVESSRGRKGGTRGRKR